MPNRALDFPILIVDADFHSSKASGVAFRKLSADLENLRFKTLPIESMSDAAILASSFNSFSCILISVEGAEEGGEFGAHLQRLLDFAHRKNERIPIFYVGERKTLKELGIHYLTQVEGVIYLFEDTSEFIARQIARAAHRHLDDLLPPFFKALVKHAEESNYSWHTPGHAGGVAFIKSPVGRAFHQFYGENLFRTDLSISVPELGSLLDHTGPLAAAEIEAARTFGADHTMFVVNGNSTANKIVWHAMVGRDDVVLVDRNCHKSIMHVIMMTGAIPVYLEPSRNRYGIIGPISLDQFSPGSISTRIKANPLASGRGDTARMAVITNSTYDGACYHVGAIKEQIRDAVDALHFDEAWLAYSGFHPLYDDHHALSKASPAAHHPIVFSTQSTHKLLAAFSQAAMIHIRDSQTQTIDRHRFNDAFMMHTSTSPNYPIIASLDVASRMMAGTAGNALVQDTIDEAITFRRIMREKFDELTYGDWWFSVWQPDDVPLLDDPVKRENWVLEPGADWHGFPNLSSGQAMLDPLKVTILCPGLDAAEGEPAIPAAVLSKYLWEQGITVEKTGVYSVLVLFSMGITKGKWNTLFTELLRFKNYYDRNEPLDVVLKSVAPRKASKEEGLRDRCDAMHQAYTRHQVMKTVNEMYGALPEPAMRPADAYDALVHGKVEAVNIRAALGRVAATMVVPTPPGIPLIMPGERFTADSMAIVEFLSFARDFDHEFPGFEIEIHGLRTVGSGSDKEFLLDCVKE